MNMRFETEDDLVAFLRKREAPVHVQGGGTRRIAAVTGEGIDTSGLSGVRIYEPGALTLVAGAGTPMAEIEAVLAGERQREMAYRFGVNLVMHVLTGNYKSDQVHVPALLERLGQ